VAVYHLSRLVVQPVQEAPQLQREARRLALVGLAALLLVLDWSAVASVSPVRSRQALQRSDSASQLQTLVVEVAVEAPTLLRRPHLLAEQIKPQFVLA
jgi:hypothetical protein